MFGPRLASRQVSWLSWAFSTTPWTVSEQGKGQEQRAETSALEVKKLGSDGRADKYPV